VSIRRSRYTWLTSKVVLEEHRSTASTASARCSAVPAPRWSSTSASSDDSSSIISEMVIALRSATGKSASRQSKQWRSPVDMNSEAAATVIAPGGIRSHGSFLPRSDLKYPICIRTGEAGDKPASSDDEGAGDGGRASCSMVEIRRQPASDRCCMWTGRCARTARRMTRASIAKIP
jgi:hypothetical protein